MPSIEEVAGNGGPLHDAIMAGLADLSQQQPFTFTTYSRYSLPLDGSVFWLRRGSIEAHGVLHYSTERHQNEDETATSNSIVFTTGSEIVDLNEPNPDTLLVGEVEGMKYSFTRQGWFFPPAAVWHYTGDALQPAFLTQLVDNPERLDASQVIVSNSLPAWLALFNYRPVWLTPLNPEIPLYPSYLVPANLVPPYGVVHIDPNSTIALQSAPWLNRDSSHYQLTSEDVRITLYGCNNSQALDLLDLINRYSYDWNIIGIMNMPTVRDGKRAAPEAMVLAQQKFIDVKVSYVQKRINDLARQMLLEAQATVLGIDLLIPSSWIYVQTSVFAEADVLLAGFKTISAEIDASGDLTAFASYVRSAVAAPAVLANLRSIAYLGENARPSLPASTSIAAFGTRIATMPAQVALQGGVVTGAQVIQSASFTAPAAFQMRATGGVLLDSTAILLPPNTAVSTNAVIEDPISSRVTATAGVQTAVTQTAMARSAMPVLYSMSATGTAIFSPVSTIPTEQFVAAALNVDFSLSFTIPVTDTYYFYADLYAPYFAKPNLEGFVRQTLSVIYSAQPAVMPANYTVSYQPSVLERALATVPLASAVSAQAQVMAGVGMPLAPLTGVTTSSFAIRPASATMGTTIGFSVTLPSIILTTQRLTLPAAVSMTETTRLVIGLRATLPLAIHGQTQSDDLYAFATVPGSSPGGLTSGITPSAATHYHTVGPFSETESTGTSIGGFTDTEP